ncbi:putative zinc alcohol dehydrogenase [Pseudovirgaria hyperparasitica]|uniref:Zinc alcohol dehydrogenase n=1 Tax=Pseudovirgaria hyperparasitica TaxID=470096 RepID=A0A6A6W2N0_9PEZI|nr:putative zinc alcohol dehydrogenase [Pseudovirgaria hyperparasitica]KAF2755847.1 putative zinc alcohol dehydrogenase [Pseudovirgaria hyperparasitica]
MTEKLPTQMRAWQYVPSQNALPKSLILNTTAPLPPSSGLLVRVTSMSTNPVDYKIAEAGAPFKYMLSTPTTPGQDFSGTVVSVPSSSSSLSIKPGDSIFGLAGPLAKHGALGEFVAPKLDAVALIPEGVSHDDAAALPTAGVSALQSIVPYVKPQSGARVLLNGGSGAVGTYGIQIAKLLGAHVTVTCSSANISLCKELGADEVVDYKAGDVIASLGDKGPMFDLVVDNVGSPAELYPASNAFLKPQGTFVKVAGMPSLGDLGATLSAKLRPAMLGGGKAKHVFMMMASKEGDLKQLASWLKEGKIKTVIDSTYEFEEAPNAYEKQKTGRARGNIIVHVSKA